MITDCPLPPRSRVVGYFRDSGGPDQQDSIAQQVALYHQYNKQHQLISVGEFIDEATSGRSTKDRNGFHRMIALLDGEPRPADGIIIWSSARFARNHNDSTFYKAMLRRKGYTFIYLSGDVPNAGPLTAFFEAAVDWKNQQYLDDMKKEIKRGIAWVAEQGAWIGGTPTGFKNVKQQIGTKRNGKARIVTKIVPDPDVMPRVIRAFKMRAKGNSYAEIHAECQLYKCHTAHGNYSHMLANEIYIGVCCISDKRIENFIEPVIPRELWDKVQA
ncbi:MAG TPA: recombinase family protein, partial [Anaerolineae bacterium]